MLEKIKNQCGRTVASWRVFLHDIFEGMLELHFIYWVEMYQIKVLDNLYVMFALMQR